MKRILLFILIAPFFNSCDTETGGCTDPLADNYQKYVDYDDGSCLYVQCYDLEAINYNVLSNINYQYCIYNSDVVFYLDVEGAVFFDNQGVNFLDLYVESEYVGTLQTNLGFSFIPNCYPIDPDAVHFTIEWENATTGTFLWTVRDESGFMWYNGTENILPNDCTSMGLTWKKIKEYNNL